MHTHPLYAVFSVAQRIIHTPDDRTVGAELLTRVKSPVRRTNMESFIHSLSVDALWAITERQLQEARDIHERWGMPCSINIDNRMIENDEGGEHLVALLEQNPGPLTLEFTETFPMPEPDGVNALFRRCRETGATIALDDFGTGFNGMSLFTDYDFDTVKIDRRLILDIEQRPQKANILKLVGDMITVLDKKHVVEGVETYEQLTCLQDMGFNCFQGYYFHQPEAIFEMRFD